LEKDVLVNLASNAGSDLETKKYDLKEVEPYNEADMY
jgi:hypothetical protein